MKLTIRDVHKRVSRLSSAQQIHESEMSFSTYNKAIDKKNPSDIMFCIENWNKLPMGNETAKFEAALYLFDILCECGNEGQIRSAAYIISEDTIPKNKSAKEIQSTLRRKLGHLKSKVSTRVNNNVSKTLDALNHTATSAKNNFKKNTARASAAVNAVKDGTKAAKKSYNKNLSKNEETIIKCYEQMEESATRMLHADRIIGNYDKLSKRFNIDKVIGENTRKFGVADATASLCRLVDTYNIPNRVKFNTVLETMWYGLNKNAGKFSNRDIINTACDYFVMKENGVEDCKFVLEATMLFDKDDDMRDVEYITEEEPEEDEPVQESVEEVKDKLLTYAYGQKTGVTPESVTSTISRFAARFRELAEKNIAINAFMQNHYEASDKYINGEVIEDFLHGPGNAIPIGYFKYISPENNKEIAQVVAELINIVNKEMDSSIFELAVEMLPIEKPDGSMACNFTINFMLKDRSSTDTVREAAEEDNNSKFQKIVNDFKKSNEDKKENKLKNLVSKLYTKSVDNIVEETPNFLGWIRQVFVLGTVAINPICGAIVAIADQFIRLHMERDECEKMLKALKAEQEKTEKKMDSIDDDDQIDRLSKYSSSLDEAINKIDEYYSSMLTDKELDAQYASDGDDVEEDNFKNILGDDEDDNDDDDFDFTIESAVSMIPRVYELSKDIDVDFIKEYVYGDFIKENCDSSLLGSVARAAKLFPDMINPIAYSEALSNLREEQRANENGTYLKYIKIANISEAIDICNSNIEPLKVNNIFEAYDYMNIMNEVYNSIKLVCDIHSSRSPLLETSFKNSLKLAGERLKKGMQKLADKDRSISRTIDSSVSNFSKAVERSLTNDNREAVIKGSILPSASKMLKLALTGGAVAILIDPVISVIGVLGYIACSKRYKYKEKQLVLDEIEVELEMVEKYISVAESKNDMKSLRSMLKAKKELERQRARIKYNMKMYAGKDLKSSDAYE